MFTDIDNTDTDGDFLVLKPLQYTDTNGNAQTIYVQQPAIPAAANTEKPKSSAHQKIHFHLSTVFLGLGIVSFGLGILVAFKKVQK